VGETEFALAQSQASEADGGAVIGAIVSYADLRLGGAVEEVLAAHVKAGDGRFRGIRHATSADPDPAIRGNHVGSPLGLMGTAPFREGLAVLAAMDLTFDAWLYHPQIGELAAAARAVPDAVIILDHLGGPLGIGPYRGRRAEIFAQWRESIRALAACPNVVAKLGGLVMPLNGFGFHKRPHPITSQELAAATREWYLHAIDCFGPSRCMFESNFPVDKVSASYRVLWNAFKRITEKFSTADKAALYHDTAVRVYRVGALE
jgi:L-fuconolactonase